jgi:hypothetical protein
MHLTASTSELRPPIEAREKIINETEDRKLLELVASQAPEPGLRKIALAKINRQGFLGDRAVQDPDPDLRRLAAAGVTQHSTLRRIIEGSRKTDKTLHQELTIRLHRELLAAKDPEAVREEAQSVCEEIEIFALHNSQGSSEIPASIAARWGQISASAPADLAVRFESTVQRLEQAANTPEAAPSPATTAAQSPETREQPEVQAETETDSGPGPGEPAQTLADPGMLDRLVKELDALNERFGESPPLRKFRDLQARWEQAWASLASPVDRERALNEKAVKFFATVESAVETARRQKEQSIEQASTLLDLLKQQLDDGALHKALETRHKIQELGKDFKKDRQWKSIHQQVSSWHGRIRELRDWHHWSNDKIRKQLISEMEILPQADLHPDALLDRVKSLQKQWKDLETSEQIPGDSHYHAAPWMWRKFSAAGHKAFAAAKPFLEKRDEIRDRQLQSMKDLCEQIREASAAEAPDWTSLGGLLRKARKEFRDLDQIPQKARRKIASKLRAALDKGNAAMQGHYAEVEKEKLKLVRAAAQLAHVDDMDEAIREAKRLQADWKSAGSLWRKRENELWKAFREPLDPLFGKLKENQDSERAEIRERLEVQEALCKGLEDVLSESDEQLAGLQGKVQGFKDGWRDIERPNRRLQDRFRELATRFDQRISAFQQQQADQIRQAWWDKSKILHELENARLEGPLNDQVLKKAEADWPSMQSAEEIDAKLDARMKSLSEGEEIEPINPDTADRAAELCIQLEFVAGLPSPKNEKDQRMKYQVDRLSKSLSGDTERLSALEEAHNVEQEWLTLPVLAASKHVRLQRRIKQALKKIKEDNSV